MLEKIKDQENIIMMFFVVVLIGVGSYIVYHVNIVDFIYFGVVMYYFAQFLRIRTNRK